MPLLFVALRFQFPAKQEGTSHQHVPFVVIQSMAAVFLAVAVVRCVCTRVDVSCMLELEEGSFCEQATAMPRVCSAFVFSGAAGAAADCFKVFTQKQLIMRVFEV